MYRKPLTKEEVYERLHQQGDTVKSWAERNGYEYGQVLNVTNGRNKATRGLGREIAIKLGMRLRTPARTL